MLIRKIISQCHWLQICNLIFWSSSEIIYLLIVSCSEELSDYLVDEEFCILVRVPGLHVEQSVEDCLRCTEPFQVLCSKHSCNYWKHFEKVLLVLIFNSVNRTNSRDLILNDLLKGKHCLLHDYKIRWIVLCKLEWISVELLLLVK